MVLNGQRVTRRESLLVTVSHVLVLKDLTGRDLFLFLNITLFFQRLSGGRHYFGTFDAKSFRLLIFIEWAWISNSLAGALRASGLLVHLSNLSSSLFKFTTTLIFFDVFIEFFEIPGLLLLNFGFLFPWVLYFFLSLIILTLIAIFLLLSIFAFFWWVLALKLPQAIFVVLTHWKRLFKYSEKWQENSSSKWSDHHVSKCFLHVPEVVTSDSLQVLILNVYLRLLSKHSTDIIEFVGLCFHRVIYHFI